MPRGGLRPNTKVELNHYFKPKWNNKKTTAIRIPEVFKDTLLSLARYLDKPEIQDKLHNFSDVVELVENYSEFEKKNQEYSEIISKLKNENLAIDNQNQTNQNIQKNQQNKYKLAVECFGEFVESQNLNFEDLSKARKGTKKHQLFEINQWLIEQSINNN